MRVYDEQSTLISSYRGFPQRELNQWRAICAVERAHSQNCGVKFIRSSASLLILEWTEKEGGEVYL